MPEESLEVAIHNAEMNFEVVSSSLPRHLVDKEEKLLEWYQKAKGNPHNKLRALYDFMTELYGSINKFLPCRKGCTACCHYPVSITVLEAEYIERETKLKRQRAILNSWDRTSACPFLTGGKCSIYDHRPFVCRRHVALTQTSYWCDSTRANTGKFPLLSFTEVERVFQTLIKEAKQDKFYDIRQLFSPEKTKKK